MSATRLDMTRRGFLSLAGASAALMALPVTAREARAFGGPAFGSYWRVTPRAALDAVRLRHRIEAVIAEIDLAMSPFRADSEITGFNVTDTRDWVSVSPQTRLVAGAALSLAGFTKGAFDPTVGPIVGRYGFGPIGGVRGGDYTALALKNGAICRTQDNVSLDLCGIAKGYALDRLVAVLEAEGLDDFLIELGGEVSARGLHPSGRDWQVAVEQPLPGGGALSGVLTLNGLSVATSGDAINGYESGGKRIGHIIDPMTGLPATGSLASVSVLDQSAMRADGLATALFAMETEAGIGFAEGQGIDALFQIRDGAGYKTVTTGGFARHMLG